MANENQPAPDLLDQLAGIQPGSAAAAARALRPEAARYTQESYDALLEPADFAGVSRAERYLIALRVAVLDRSQPLIDHYAAALRAQDVPAEKIDAVLQGTNSAALTPREQAILAHTERLTLEPRSATPEHLAELKQHDLTARDIVSIAQLIAFMSFQVRVLAGLKLLNKEAQ